jgi:hypothetical protein
MSRRSGTRERVRGSRDLRILILALLFVPGCTVATFTNSEGPARTNEEVATVNNRWACPFCIRWIQRSEDQVVVFDVQKSGAVNPLRLTPGRYVIVAGYDDPVLNSRASMHSTVDLQAGHSYTVHMSNTLIRMFAHSRVWMTDDTEDRIVADSN